MATDPVCGMEVDEAATSFVTDLKGVKFYFCSFSCQDEFERNPEKYTPKAQSTTVANIMSIEVAEIQGDTPVADAAKQMVRKEVSSILVTAAGKAVGIVTERDLVRRVMADGFDPAQVMVKDIMTTPLVTVAPTTTIEEASRIMSQYRVRRLPVVQDGTLVGLVTVSDVALLLAKRKGFKDHQLNAIARYCVAPVKGPYE